MREIYHFSLFLVVEDPPALRAAAMAHEDCDPDDSLLGEEGEVRIGDCLSILLDPGSLSGCNVSNVDTQQQEGDAQQYEFFLSISVHSPSALRLLSLSHKNAGGSTFLREDGQVDVEECLGILLDRSSLAGCTTLLHEVSRQRPRRPVSKAEVNMQLPNPAEPSRRLPRI